MTPAGLTFDSQLCPYLVRKTYIGRRPMARYGTRKCGEEARSCSEAPLVRKQASTYRGPLSVVQTQSSPRLPATVWWKILAELSHEDIKSMTLLCSIFRSLCQPLLFRKLVLHPYYTSLADRGFLYLHRRRWMKQAEFFLLPPHRACHRRVLHSAPLLSASRRETKVGHDG